MKTSKYISIVAVSLLISFSGSVLARSKVNVDINLGGRQDFHHGQPDFHRGYRPDFQRGYRPDYRFDCRPRHFEPVRGWQYYRPYQRTVIVSSGPRPDCYVVVAPPRVIERPPVVIERQTVVYSTISPQVVQPQQFDDSTLQRNINLQYRKSDILKQLQMPDKELRRQAIRELAGFSFDDNVRYTLENILLSDPDPELRAEAADAFGQVKNANARPALEKARVEDPSADVRRAADEAIRSIEGN